MKRLKYLHRNAIALQETKISELESSFDASKAEMKKLLKSNEKYETLLKTKLP